VCITNLPEVLEIAKYKIQKNTEYLKLVYYYKLKI